MNHRPTDDEIILSFDPFAGDFDGPGDALLRKSMVVVRKLHHCHHCQGPIRVGERVRSEVARVDGEIMTARHCAACCAAIVADYDYETGLDDEDADEDAGMWFELRAATR